MNEYITYAIIVTYNPEMDLLEKQYHSLCNQVSGIVYIDNGSENIERIKQFLLSCSRIYYEFNSNNVGLGAAQNQGIEKAFELGANHILLLDQDSVLEGNTVEKLQDSEEKLLLEHKVGLVSPALSNITDNKIFSVEKYINSKRFKIMPAGDFPVEASFLSASGSLIQKDVLLDIGLMDEGLFIDFIDRDWCARASAKGYHLFVIPSTKINHTVGDKRIKFLWIDMAYHSPLRRYYTCRGSIIFFKRKYYSFGLRLQFLLGTIIRTVIMIVSQRKRKAFFIYSVQGFIDGMKNMKGAYQDKKS